MKETNVTGLHTGGLPQYGHGLRETAVVLQLKAACEADAHKQKEVAVSGEEMTQEEYRKAIDEEVYGTEKIDPVETYVCEKCSVSSPCVITYDCGKHKAWLNTNVSGKGIEVDAEKAGVIKLFNLCLLAMAWGTDAKWEKK